MHFLLPSIVCSVAVSILLKLTGRYQIDVRQAIVFNYPVAAAATWWLLGPDLTLLVQPEAYASWPLFIALGLLLPTVFVALAKSVQQLGIVRSDAAQRLSLLIPLIAAFTVFGEPLEWQNAIGVGLGLLAVGCLVARHDTGIHHGGHSRAGWAWLVAVFVGFGAIDILFKAIAQESSIPFSSLLLACFLLAFVLAMPVLGWLYYRHRAIFSGRQLLGGLLLGLLNFGNIVFYIKAHQSLPQHPALVFATMNIGVIVVAALFGLLVFKEPLNRWNRLGIGLALLAVALLTGYQL